MTILFYPQDDELESADVDGKLEILLSAAERYKASVLDTTGRLGGLGPTLPSHAAAAPASGRKGGVPRDIIFAYNWDGLADLLRTTREMSEAVPSSRLAKSMRLERLATIYEVLRGARMPKLEAVRLAIMSEVAQLTVGK